MLTKKAILETVLSDNATVATKIFELESQRFTNNLESYISIGEMYKKKIFANHSQFKRENNGERYSLNKSEVEMLKAMRVFVPEGNTLELNVRKHYFTLLRLSGLPISGYEQATKYVACYENADKLRKLTAEQISVIGAEVQSLAKFAKSKEAYAAYVKSETATTKTRRRSWIPIGGNDKSELRLQFWEKTTTGEYRDGYTAEAASIAALKFLIDKYPRVTTAYLKETKDSPQKSITVMVGERENVPQ